MAYKHSRWQNEKVDDDSFEDLQIERYYEGQKSTESHEENIFAHPHKQVGGVITALDDYLRRLEDMKLSKRDLLKQVVELCPLNAWPNMHELCIYLDDQAEIWEVTGEHMNSLSHRLKEYETQIDDARAGLEVYLTKQTELFNMTAEYNKMQKTGKIPKTQSTQIKFMVAESERAMALIKADTEKKLLNFKKTHVEIGKDFLELFQEALQITYTESLQIIAMIKGILGNIPVRKLNVFRQPRDDVEFVLSIMEKANAKARLAYNKNSPRNRGDTSEGEHRFTSPQARGNNDKTAQSRQFRPTHSTQMSEQSPPASKRQYYANSTREPQTRASQGQERRQEAAGRVHRVTFTFEDSSKEEAEIRESRDRTKRSTSYDEKQRRSPYRTRTLQEESRTHAARDHSPESRTHAARDHSPYRYMYQDVNGLEDVNYMKAAQTKHQLNEERGKSPDKGGKKPYQRAASDETQVNKSLSTNTSNPAQGRGYYRR